MVLDQVPGSGKSPLLGSEVGKLLIVSSCGRRGKGTLWSRFYKDTNPTFGVPSMCAHLNPIIHVSKRPHFQILSHLWRLKTGGEDSLHRYSPLTQDPPHPQLRAVTYCHSLRGTGLRKQHMFMAGLGQPASLAPGQGSLACHWVSLRCKWLEVRHPLHLNW